MEIVKLNFDQIYELREILAGGELTTCQKTIRAKICPGCCSRGIILFPGELELLKKEQKEGLFSSRIVVRKHLEECFDFENLACLMGKFKPLACQLAPEICVHHVAELILANPNESCHAREAEEHLKSDFFKKAELAKNILRSISKELLPTQDEIMLQETA